MALNICALPPTPSRFKFLYGDEEIIFDRTERPGDADSILIKVHPDCRVVVHAPFDSSDADVLLAVKKRSRWIYQQLQAFKQQQIHHSPRRYISGESHFYLGKQHLLKVIKAPATAQGVKLLRGKLELTVRDRSIENKRMIMLNWYKARAKEVFNKRLDAVLDQTLWVSDKPPLRLLAMKTQWGSCSPTGKLTLNPHLVKAPRECIDYVILHELCHIAEHNHSDKFYRLMTKVMPEWREIKEKLDSMANKIIY